MTKSIAVFEESLNKNEKQTMHRNRLSNEALNKEEVEKLLNGIDNIEDKTFFQLGLNTGMRVSEITNIDRARIDYAENRIKIYDKKKSKDRIVYPTTQVMSLLKVYENYLDKLDKKGKLNSPLLFNFTTKTAERKIQKWTSLTLNKMKSWHCVRHTYISRSSEEGINPAIVVYNTGDDPATILKYYTQLSPTFIKSEVDKKPLY